MGVLFPLPPPQISHFRPLPLMQQTQKMVNRRPSSRNFQSSKPSPSSVLHMQLDECVKQFKLLEKERKQTETKLAQHYPGRDLYKGLSFSD